jgi:predicted nucleotidyltransferase
MRKVFTTLASSRFIDQAAVIEALRQQARHLKIQQVEVTAVYLFGSFATGTATPRSDADVVVEIPSGEAALRQQIRDAAFDIFLGAPVPVDLFVMSSAELNEGKTTLRGIVGRVAQEGLRLA